MKKNAILTFIYAIGFVTGSARAEFDPAMCSGYEEAAKWSQEQDALSAASKNHRVIFEGEEIRVLEVTVQPGERENLHHHRWPSAMIVDSRPKYVNYDKDGNEIKPAVQAPGNPVMPIMVRLPAQAAHYIHNVDSKPFHAVRIEYKKACSGQ